MLGNVGYRNFASTPFSPAALFAASEPGVWYDPSDVANTLWVRNLLTFTEQFDNAIWTKNNFLAFGSGSVANTTATTDPLGGNTADLLVTAAATAATRVYQGINSNTGQVNTTTWYVKKQTGSAVRWLRFTADQTGAGVNTYFDLDNGVFGTVGAGITPFVVSLPNGWYRVGITYAAVATDTSDQQFVNLANNNNISAAYVGDGTSGFYIWGAQTEISSTPTEYQPIITVNAGTIARFPQATLYQDSAGTTPVTAPNQPVGLMLDKSQGLVLGPQLVTNGNFDSGTTGWVYPGGTGGGGGITVSNGRLRLTVATPLASIDDRMVYTQLSGLTVGRSYAFSGFMIALTGTVEVRLTVTAVAIDAEGNGILGSTASQSGETITSIFTATATTMYVHGYARGTVVAGSQVAFDNISVKLLPGNHATQSTSGSRPTYGIVPATGRRNLLQQTEVFTNAYWLTQGGSWSAVNSTGFQTFTEDTGLSQHRLYKENLGMTSGLAYTLSARVSYGTRQWVFLSIFDGTATVSGWFDLLNGIKGSVSASASTIMSTVAPGVYDISLTRTAAGTTANGNVQIGTQISDNASTSWTANGSSVNVSRYQFEQSATATAYQKVVTAFEVTEANVASLSYISFDGIDDSMVTPTIDPSAGVTPGPELVTNGTFAINVNGWTFEATATNTSTPGFLSGTTGPSTNLLAHQIVTTVVGRTYTCVILTGGASTAVYVSPSTPGGLTLGSTGFATNGTRTLTFVATSTTTYLSVMAVGAVSNAVLDNISLREIVADKVQVFAGVRKLSDAAIGMVAELSVNVGSNAGSFYFAAPEGLGVDSNFTFKSRGSINTFGIATSGIKLSPISAVITTLGDISADTSTMRFNGAQISQSTSDQGTGNLLAYPMYIGRRGGTTFPFNGQMYGLITRFGANLTTTAISRTESWMNNKTGAY
jgi:hypothetical protein